MDFVFFKKGINTIFGSDHLHNFFICSSNIIICALCAVSFMSFFLFSIICNKEKPINNKLLLNFRNIHLRFKFILYILTPIKSVNDEVKYLHFYFFDFVDVSMWYYYTLFLFSWIIIFCVLIIKILYVYMHL